MTLLAILNAINAASRLLHFDRPLLAIIASRLASWLCFRRIHKILNGNNTETVQTE